MKKGLFIALEGIDGTGKSTQAALLKKTLEQRGYKVLLTREPGGTNFAEKVRQLVLDATLPLNTATQALLYLAARSEHVEKLLRPALDEGQIVICDRFSASTLVYQGYAAGKSPAEIEQLAALNAYATGGLAPDITLILDAPPAALLERRKKRGLSDRYEDAGLKLQLALRKGFLALAEGKKDHCIVDALAAEEEVKTRLLEVLEPLLPPEA